MKHSLEDTLICQPMSRQRMYQLRMQRAGLCTICGEPLAEGSRALCLEHLIRARENQRRKQGCKRRYSNTLSYNLEAAA